MQEVFEKIIERLEENQTIVFRLEGGKPTQSIDLVKAIENVKQTAAEYNNGWIPCSERLPEELLNSLIGWDAYRERCVFVQYIGGRFVIGDDTESVKITHWMDVPYQPKGE